MVFDIFREHCQMSAEVQYIMRREEAKIEGGRANCREFVVDDLDRRRRNETWRNNRDNFPL